MKLLAHTGSLLALCLLLCRCSSVVPADAQFASFRCQSYFTDNVDGAGTYQIGAILSLSTPGGQPDFDGNFDVQAMRLALKELNDNRDIGGKRFSLRVCDTSADWSTGGGQVTRDLTNWLIDHEKVSAIISDASADTQTIASITIHRNVLLLAISATSEELTSLNDFVPLTVADPSKTVGLVWRIAPSDIYQGAVLAQLVSSTVADDTSNITVFAMQSPYGDGLVDALGKQSVHGNSLLPRLKKHTFALDGTGLEAAVVAAKDDQSGAIIIVGDEPLTAKIINAAMGFPGLAQAIPGHLLIADGACDEALSKQTYNNGVTLAGAHCTRPGQPESQAYKDFRERFMAVFQRDPVQSSYTQHSYDAMYCLAMAHAWALGSKGLGSADGKGLAEGLRHLSTGTGYGFKPANVTAMETALQKGMDINVDGTSGPLDFNPDTGEAPADYEDWTLDAKGVLISRTFWAVQDLGNNQFSVLPAAASGTTP